MEKAIDQTVPPISQVQEKTPWEMNRNELIILLKEAIPKETADTEDNKKQALNPDTLQAMNVFTGQGGNPGLVKLITDIAIDQISKPSGLSWEQSSPEGTEALQTYLKDVVPSLQESNPTLAKSLDLVSQKLLSLPGSNQDQMNQMALKLENWSWQGYSNGKPVILFPQDDIWIGIMCPDREPSWDARAILMLPILPTEQLVVKNWADQVINLYQRKFPNLDLGQLEQIRLFVGNNVAHTGTELASHTAGESLVNGVMIDLNGCYPIEGNLTEPETMGLYTRIMIAHELAHKVQEKAMGNRHKELEEWMCDILAWRAITDYIGQSQFDEDKQQELMKALETQTKSEFASTGIANREDSTIKGYRASGLWFMESRKNNPDLKSWINHLDKVISSLWEPESEEAQSALNLEEKNAQEG